MAQCSEFSQFWNRPKVAGLEPCGFDWHNVVFGREGRLLDYMSALPHSRAQLLGVSLKVTNTKGSGNISWPSLV